MRCYRAGTSVAWNSTACDEREFDFVASRYRDESLNPLAPENRVVYLFRIAGWRGFRRQAHGAAAAAGLRHRQNRNGAVDTRRRTAVGRGDRGRALRMSQNRRENCKRAIFREKREE